MIVARLFHVHLPSCPRTCSQTDTLTVHRYADDCQLNLKHNHYLIDSLNTLPTSRNGWVPVGCACASTLTITSHPAQFAAANWQGDVTVIAVVIDHNSRHSTRPRCDRRQPADHVGTCRRCVPVGAWILTAAPICHTVISAKAATTAVHAFISSRLDYCNSLLFGISDNLLQRLQAVQNAAVSVLFSVLLPVGLANVVSVSAKTKKMVSVNLYFCLIVKT